MDKFKKKRTHSQIMFVTLFFILIMAISGLFFGIISSSKSILTDGIVSLVIFCSSFLGIYIQRRLRLSDDTLYPYGRWRFQNIYNLLRMITLLLIILYSFLEAIFTIYHYLFENIIPPEIDFVSAIPYFIIKMVAVFLALSWLSLNKDNLNNEEYKVEFTSISVDGVLTLAIIIGMAVFANIALIQYIADSLTLLIVAIILGISIFKELKALINLMIGKKIYVTQEQAISQLINRHYQDFYFKDIHLENQGIITQVFITCYFDDKKTMEDFLQLQIKAKELLQANGFDKTHVHFYFEQ
ncbi:MAG: cation transporter [Mycoplasmatales bacterium]